MKQIENLLESKEFKALKKYIEHNLNNFNILEIVGMGTQEIKHSNLLSHFFKEEQFLEKFLQKVIDANSSKNIQVLPNYLPKEKELKIFREKDNIDLLIEDRANKTLIVIENKLYANESEGQLKSYEEKMKKYRNWNKIFIFLTIDLKKPSQQKWLLANYEMISSALEELLQENEYEVKEKILKESYIDLLKRRVIVEDKNLQKLCDNIWENDEYAKALEILLNYRKTKTQKILDKLEQKYNFQYYPHNLELQSIKKLYEKFKIKRREDNEVFEVQINFHNYNNPKIWIGYWYPNLKGQNNPKLEALCKKIANRLHKKYTTIKEITNEDIKDKSVEEVYNEIVETIEEIDRNIFEVLDNKI